jgi:CRP-like cAMP-binding protein
VQGQSSAQLHAQEFIRSYGWLRDTPAIFQDALLSRCQLIDVNAGAVLWDVDEEPNALYGLVSGQVVSSVPTRKGVHLITHIRQPSAWFGEVSTLIKSPRRTRVATTRPSQLFSLSVGKLNELLTESHPGEEDSEAWRQFARLLVAETNMVTRAASDLMLRDPRARCSAVVLRLAGTPRAGRSPDMQPEIDISQDDLATLCNLSRNAVGTILRNLAKAGVLEPKYKCIKVFDAAALMSVAYSDS